MKNYRKFTQEDVSSLFRSREGETKLGQTISLSESDNAHYEIIGIPESIGVRANFGIAGTETSWRDFLKVFLNLQDNRFLSGEDIYLSGFFEFPNFEGAPVEELRKEVEKIDEQVREKIYETVAAGRIPIIIGGGHNNAYGNIKGSSQALGMPLSVINFDAHADFRKLEGRHSGNGFSYAHSEGFLKRYSIFGLQKSYVSESMLESFNDTIQAQFYDELCFLSPSEFQEKIKNALKQCDGLPLGIEIDLDAIENVLSSASSPVGFSVPQAMHFIKSVKKDERLVYMHLCEGASQLYDGRQYPGIGKLLAEMVAEFIRR